jgi:hypothetical protein
VDLLGVKHGSSNHVAIKYLYDLNLLWSTPQTLQTPVWIVSRRPGADIVPAVLHAKHGYTGVLAAGEILLYRLVCAVGIASQNSAAELEKIVYPVADRRVQSPKSDLA